MQPRRNLGACGVSLVPMFFARVLGVFVALVASSGVAHADRLQATRNQPLFEVSHSVVLRLEGGVAIYKVKRQFANPGTIADEAGLEIDMPPGGAATGLRIRAKSRWYDGELMEREKAAALYKEMTGFGAYAPKDPALLQWLWADKLYLQVFPVLPGEVSTVEYTITVPTNYNAGRYWVSYPRIDVNAAAAAETSLPLATPTLSVQPNWGDALLPIMIDGKRAAPDTAVVLTKPPRQAWQDAVAADETASYVASALVMPASSHTDKAFSTAKVNLDIRHTYKSDLRVELLAPNGTHVTLFKQDGGGDNNLNGSFAVTLPEPTQGAGTWRLVVSDHVGLDNGVIEQWQLTLGDTTVAATDTPIFIPDAPENASDAGLAAVSVAAPPITLWTARLGKVVASKAHAFTRLEVDVAAELVPLPKKAQIVFALDTSFSVTEEMIDAQLAIIRTYLSHIPDAEVEIITYRRAARRVFGRFVNARDIAQELATAKTQGAFALGNGSALDAAARLSTTTLKDRQGPRRLVLTTDRLLRPALSAELALDALSSLPKDVVVHVVAPALDHDDRVSLTRTDSDPLSPLATRHHGIFVDLGGLPAKTDKDLVPVVLELVRPTRIEQLSVDGDIPLVDTVLKEGEGIRWFASHQPAPSRVVLRGLLWSDPVRREVVANDQFSRATAAFVFGADEHTELSTEEQLTVAFMGRAVSPVTSYVAAEPGTRPSTIGLTHFGSASGRGMGAGYGRSGLSQASRTPPDLRKMIDTTECVAMHKPSAPWRVQLTVDTTLDEIVDVTVTAGAGSLATCLQETTWRVRLDARFSLEREQFVLELDS